MADEIAVEVVCATPEQTLLRRVKVAPHSSVMHAIEASNILKEYPAIRFDLDQLGIFSRRVSADHLLKEGDRIEIYRSLTHDPMDARRNRARAKRL